jgi:hypothetical protein
VYGACTRPTPHLQTLFPYVFNGANSYGWLSALTTFGSCVGLISWNARMQQLVNLLIASDLIVRRNFEEVSLYQAEAAKWQAAFSVTYAVEFFERGQAACS